MLTSFLAAALALQAAPASPSAPSIRRRKTARCCAARRPLPWSRNGRRMGDAGVAQWPALGTRGREFFVRALAQLMDDTGLDRDGIAALAGLEAKALQR
jgi:hypothetical protein